VTVNGGGSDHVNVNDQDAGFSDTYDITNSTLSRIIFGGLTYSGIAGLTLNAETGNNTINIHSTSAPVTVNDDAGSDIVNVGDPGLLFGLDNLPGAVTVNGGGSDHVNVNDQDASFTDSYTLTSSTFSRPFFGGLTYSGIAGLTINAQTGSNTITVVSTSPSTPVTINGDGGTDTLVGPNTANTWTITGANAGTVGNVTFSAVWNLTGGTANDIFKFTGTAHVSGMIDGGGGTNTLGYGGYSTGVTVNLGAGTATGTGGVTHTPNVNGSPFNDSITGGSGNNVINGNGGNDTLNGGAGGNDTFILGSTQGSSTTVTGDGVGDTLQGANVANTWTITGANAGNVNGIAFTGINNLTGGTAADTLIGPNAATSTIWSITANNAGTVGSLAFSAVENLTGGSGVDEFVLSNGVGVSGKIDGGGAHNWLDYAAYTTAVAVDLTANTATGAAGGIANIRDVRGGVGNDTLKGNALGNILIGGGGADTITGGGGRSILIGGKGNDTVKGASADDIVIGGITSYNGGGDANDLALEAILAEWQSSDPYATRISKIKAGVGSMLAKFVWGTTVTDDGNASTLTGGAGTDWFFKGGSDTITDLASGEQVN
jgi:RTX calcium-binding nonapeptide repeat (4 copies)